MKAILLKLAAVAFALLSVGFVHGQFALTQAELNSFQFMLSADGRMFHDASNGLPGFEAPTPFQNHTIFVAGLWAGGLDEDGSIRFSGQLFCQNGCLYGPGPLKLDGSYEAPTASPNPFNRFWIVSAFAINQHLAWFDCENDPNCDAATEFPAGYSIPQSFITWPAMGDTDNGYPQYLAPFFDYDGDGVYDPSSGDHPLICGDLAIYSIYNDIGFRNEPNATPALGIEVHQMVYGFFTTEPALRNTVFVQKRVINRSPNTYADTYLGMWNDFDIGNPFDDFNGTDVERSMVFGYNGTDFDGPSVLGPGYGSDLAAMGMRVLRGPLRDADGLDNPPLSELHESYGDQTTGWGDGVPDNERLGLSHSLVHFTSTDGAPSPTTDPVLPVERYNFMRSVWKDGSPLKFGGLGYNPTTALYTPSRYSFPGLSDPLLAGSGGVDPNYPDPEGWTEDTAGNLPGLRRLLASSGPFTFAPGDEQVLDYAYIFARDSHEPETDVLETLRSYADAIVGMECGELPQVITSVRDHRKPSLEFSIFPNPARHSVTLEVQHVRNGTYTLHDLTGRAVAQGRTSGVRTEISVGHLPKGMYLLRCEAGGEVASAKLVVE